MTDNIVSIKTASPELLTQLHTDLIELHFYCRSLQSVCDEFCGIEGSLDHGALVKGLQLFVDRLGKRFEAGFSIPHGDTIF